MAQHAKKAESVDTRSPNGTSMFGDTDLGRVQTILFGDHARQTTDRIDALEKATLAAVADLKDSVAGQMSVLTDRLAAEIETSGRGIKTLGSRLDDEATARTRTDKALRRDLEKLTDSLSNSIDATAATAAQQVEALRRELMDQIEASESGLQERKLDREALAGLLATTVSQLSAADNN